jgi:hypothetical protein
MTHAAAALTTTVFATGPLAAPLAGSLAGPESDKAGPLGLLVILLLGVATILLVRSMNRHLRKVPSSFDRPSASRRDQADEPGEPDESTGLNRPTDPEPPSR